MIFGHKSQKRKFIQKILLETGITSFIRLSTLNHTLRKYSNNIVLMVRGHLIHRDFFWCYRLVLTFQTVTQDHLRVD